MYAITAQIETHAGAAGGSVQVPTFYLDERVQGITGAAHAERIARQILVAAVNVNGSAVVATPRVHVTAVQV